MATMLQDCTDFCGHKNMNKKNRKEFYLFTERSVYDGYSNVQLGTEFFNLQKFSICKQFADGDDVEHPTVMRQQPPKNYVAGIGSLIKRWDYKYINVAANYVER